jgi:hypothetical protein
MMAMLIFTVMEIMDCREMTQSECEFWFSVQIGGNS